MKPIRIIDKDFNLLAEIDDYESLFFVRKFHIYGEFELRMNRHKNNTDKLQKGNIIFLDKRKAGIIKHREIAFDEGGKASESWIVKGYTLEHIFTQRITKPPAGVIYDEINSNAETVIKHYVENNVTNPLDLNRKIDVAELAINQNRGKSIDWKSRYKNLAEELEKISINSGIGLKMELDISNLKLIFDVYEGRDLTVSQSTNPPVIFSYDYDNVKTQHYIDSDIGYKNYGYIGGKGEGTERTIVEVGNITGIDRIETFIDARDSDTNLQQRGEQKLDEFQTVRTLEGKVLTYGPFIYEKDWDLGDIVTIQNKDWGVTMDARIIEVKEIYESSNIGLEVTFGNKVPTLIDKINQQFSQMSNEITK